jgi:hypothetical protein
MVGEVRPWYHGKYSAFFDRIGQLVSQTQVTELCSRIIRWGRDDDEKRLCQRRLQEYMGLSEKQQRADNSSVASACTILSLGCNGQSLGHLSDWHSGTRPAESTRLTAPARGPYRRCYEAASPSTESV